MTSFLNTGRSAILFFLCALIITLVIHVPFMGKALHIDDYAFLSLSKMLQWNPLQAIPRDTFYMGKVLPNLLPYEATHPLFIPYLLKILARIFGSNYTVFHLVFSFFTFLSLAGIRLICQTLPGAKGNHYWILIFLVTTPAYIVNAHNLMTDVPALGLALMGMGLYLAWIRNGSKGTCLASIVLLTLACFSAYQSILVIIPLALYQLTAEKGQTGKLAPLAIPLLILLVWLIMVYLVHNIFPLLSSKLDGDSIAGHVRMGMGWKAWLDKSLFHIATTGLTCLPFVLLYAIYDDKRLRFLRNLLLAALPCAVYVFGFSGLGMKDKVFYAAYLTTGTWFICFFYTRLASLLPSAGRRPVGIFFMSWHFLSFFIVTTFFPFASARYILPSLVPLIIFLAYSLKPHFLAQDKNKASWAILFLSAAFGFVSASVDYTHAESYKIFAEEVKTTRENTQHAFDVWYIGEWGMRYYMDRAGARYLTVASNSPVTGDLVVIPEVPRLWSPAPLLAQRLTGFADREFQSAIPLRLFGGNSKGGFYCNFWGVLPIVLFNSEPVETFTVFRVNR